MTTPTDAPGDDVSAMFVPEGGHLVPTSYAVGPWRPDAVHGAAVAALFAAALERPGCTVARITVDLLGSVPVEPLALAVTDLGRGRRVQRQVAVLSHGERTVAQAVALYVAGSGVDLPDSVVEDSLAPYGAQSAPPPEPLALLPQARTGWAGFENMAMALYTEAEDRSEFRGWFHLLVPAIAGRPVTGLQTTLAAADYTSGGAALVLSFRRWSFVSLDLQVSLARRPEGDWVGVRAPAALLTGTGIGVTTSVLHDTHGPLGRCTETQFVQPLATSGTDT